jgi:hypothetical protein
MADRSVWKSQTLSASNTNAGIKRILSVYVLVSKFIFSNIIYDDNAYTAARGCEYN